MTHEFTRAELKKQLQTAYGMREDHAIRAVMIADQMGLNAEATDNGTVTIRPVKHKPEQYTLEDGLPPEAAGRKPHMGYNKSNEPTPRGKDKKMAAKRTAQAEPEPEAEGRDLSAYADKEPTVKIQDYHEWLGEQFPDLDLDLQSVYLGVTLYPDFQKSDFNRTRTAQRREARAQDNGAADEAEAAPAKGRGKAAAAKPATGGTTGRRGKPAGRGRGRATADAPF